MVLHAHGTAKSELYAACLCVVIAVWCTLGAVTYFERPVWVCCCLYTFALAHCFANNTQVVPFASAFRPVLPTKRDGSGISRSPRPSANLPSAFQPVNTSARPQNPTSASSALPERRSSGSDSGDSPMSRGQSRQHHSPQQQSLAQAASSVAS